MGIILSIILLVIIRDKEFSFYDISERLNRDNYIMQINYPTFNGQKKINKEIKKYIDNEKKNFIKGIKNNHSKDNELNISYSYTIKDNLYSFHLRTYSIIGNDNKYYRSDKTYYFDKDNNKNIDLDNLISNKTAYNIFKEKVLDYLNNSIYDIYDKNKLSNNLNSIKDNYKIVMFGKDYIQLIIEPKKVNSYNRELVVNINYNEVAMYLNKEYFTDINVNKEEMVKSEIPQIRDKMLFRDKKLVALTFDDGPSYDKTQRLLDELDKRNARVSFFMLGEQVAKQYELVKKIYIKGHTIGSHTYDHKQLTKLKINEIRYEVDYTNEIIKNITGEDVKYLRPPYGSYNKEMLESIDMSFILWSVDVEDWKLKDEEKIKNYIIDNVKDGDIVLLHDIHSETIDGVIKAIDELQNKGYAFVSIDELISFKNIIIEKNTVYRYFR